MVWRVGVEIQAALEAMSMTDDTETPRSLAKEAKAEGRLTYGKEFWDQLRESGITLGGKSATGAPKASASGLAHVSSSS